RQTRTCTTYGDHAYSRDNFCQDHERRSTCWATCCSWQQRRCESSRADNRFSHGNYINIAGSHCYERTGTCGPTESTSTIASSPTSSAYRQIPERKLEEQEIVRGRSVIK